ncbi:RNA polymerase sigma-70 factor [Maribellus comscasis]|uniref:RNA polymerase sigma-70 factor n=1 Tax=Maribellus comscasis TaxID=2681766 RepID=A0A6I6JT06_9BACT|nr:RNA polymerase sigma-70 factor [Maribellus comscasis]QGY45601.1 RNA polymerase sigma-70 factor [Maribellus comscasis]
MQINGIDEKVLVARMISGDKTAFELLFRFYYPGLIVFASQIVLSTSEAEEIVQDFFVRLWEKRSNISNNYSLKNYLFASVKNSSFNYLKKEKIKENVIADLKQVVKEHFLYEADIYINSELQSELKRAFEKLSPRTREVFSLSRLGGLKNDEIAQKLGLSKRTVETQISNALKILRLELKDYLTLLLLFELLNL